MSQIFGPPLITNGLVAYYDIYNPACYVSGSSTLYDLSGNNNHATLVGNPEYIVKSSSYYNTPIKLLGFNGTDQYITMSNALSNVKTQMFWLNMASPYNLSVTERFGSNIYILSGSLDQFSSINLSVLGTANYIVNGEFDYDISIWKNIDSSDPEQWNADDTTYPGAAFVKGSLDHTINSDPRTTGMYHQVDTGDQVQAYIVSFWYKTSGFNEGLKVYLVDFPGNIVSNPKASAKLDLTANWTNVNILFDMGSPVNAYYLIFGKDGDIGAGVFSLDGVSVYPVNYFVENNVVKPEEYQYIASTTDYGFTLRHLMGSENANGLFYTGSFSQIMLYDRKLSEDELKKNAFAFRSRYKTY